MYSFYNNLKKNCNKKKQNILNILYRRIEMYSFIIKQKKFQHFNLT